MRADRQWRRIVSVAPSAVAPGSRALSLANRCLFVLDCGHTQRDCSIAFSYMAARIAAGEQPRRVCQTCKSDLAR